MKSCLVLLVCSLVLGGCGTPKATHSHEDSDNVELTRFWQPYLLYIRSSPHPRLYVEVAAVEGCAPSDAELEKLRAFLAVYCQKPRGIKIVRDDTIPIAAARGISPEALAREHLKGPPTNATGPPPAFIFILFYDNVLSTQPAIAQSGRSGASGAPPSAAQLRNPHVDLLPYPAMIYLNSRYGPRSVRDLELLHEAGHLLGLVGRTNHASGLHCLDPDCLMNQNLALTMHIGRLLMGRDPYSVTQKQLCSRCVAELAGNRSSRHHPICASSVRCWSVPRRVTRC